MGLICGAAGRAARPGRTRPTSPPRTWSSATSGSLTQPALGCRSAPPGHWGRVLWLVQRARRVANRIVGWATDPRARYITAGITPAVSKLAAAVSHPTSEAAYRGHRLETNQSGPDDHRSCFGIATARTRVPISCRKSTTPMQNGWRRRRGRMTVPDDLQPGAESQPVSAAGVDGLCSLGSRQVTASALYTFPWALRSPAHHRSAHSDSRYIASHWAPRLAQRRLTFPVSGSAGMRIHTRRRRLPPLAAFV
jgi:hypothetical protein